MGLNLYCPSAIASVAEIEELKKEAAAFRDVRKGLNEEEGARKTFEKVCRATYLKR